MERAHGGFGPFLYVASLQKAETGHLFSGKDPEMNGGKIFRIVLQSAAKTLLLHTVHEAFSYAKGIPPEFQGAKTLFAVDGMFYEIKAFCIWSTCGGMCFCSSGQ